MAWFKIDDRFHSHPKVVQAGNAAVGAWVRMGAWCSDYLTDGHIPDAVATSIATSTELEALMSTGLLAGTNTGYCIPDWLDYNPSADEVKATRTKRSAAAAKAGNVSSTQRAAKRQRPANADSNADTNDSSTSTQRGTQRAANEKATPHPHPYPYKNNNTDPAVDNFPEGARTVATHYATIGLTQAQARGVKISNIDGYRHALEQAALTNPLMMELLTSHPDAPASVIAAALHGETHSLRYFEPAGTDDEGDAIIIPMHERTANGN